VNARTQNRWLLLGGLAAAVALVGYFLMPSEERRVRARLDALVETLGTPSNEPDVARLARVARLRGYFADDAAVYFEREDHEPIRGRDQILGLAAGALTQLGPFSVELQNLRIAIREGAAVADVRFESRLVSRDPKADPATLDGRAVGLTLTKIDGTWLVSSARVGERDDSIRRP
jgi:ketosteroid isomerase-like protein